MFVLIWATLLFTVRGSNADTGSFPGGKEHCDHPSFCITLSEGEITAEAGLCVVIPCSFTTSSSFEPKNIVWFKCETFKAKCDDSDMIFNIKKNKKPQPGFEGRVSLLEPDVNQKNCSIIISNVAKSDSGSYRLRVNGVTPQKEDGFTFSPRVTVSVKDLIQKPTVMIPALTEGQQTTLTCTAPGLCSGSEPEITWMWRGAGEKDSHITGNITAIKTEDLTAVTQRHSSTLMFNVSAEHHGTEVTCKVIFNNSITTEETVTLNVAYVKEVKITGNTSVKEGETLNLTCSVDSFPPSLITWTNNLNINSGSATLVIPHMAAEHYGLYICTAKHLDKPLTKAAMMSYLKILHGSRCVLQSEVLTCVCISEGFPLPTIRWPLLENHVEYSVITTVSSHTVISTITLTVKHHSNTVVQCVSSSEVKEMQQNITIITSKRREDQHASSAELPWVVVAVVSLIVNIICIILLMLLWSKRKKVKSNQEDRTYMSLQKTDPSPEYDVIAPRLN